MKLFGLIGNPLTHSFSKKYFTEKFRRENISDCSYENFQLSSIEELYALIASHNNLAGLNVTIPFKELVIPFLNELDEIATETGAVNTIKISNGQLKGFNTDVYGFTESIINLLEHSHTSALILGTGGSSKAVAYGLKKMGIGFDFVSRNPDKNELGYENLTADVILQHKIIINTTPAGMFPSIESCPSIPYEHLTKSHLLFDLIYNPDETLFLQKAKARGAQIMNGMDMLKLQAEKSWEIWNS